MYSVVNFAGGCKILVPAPQELGLTIRLNQVGNTSSRKNTEIKQLVPLGWVTIQGLDVDALDANTVKSQ